MVKHGVQEASRKVENRLAMLGGGIAALYVLAAEVVPAAMASFGHCPEPQRHPVPWGVVLIVFACVLPKTLGRATAGKVWLTAIAQRTGIMRAVQAPTEPQDGEGGTP